MASNRVRSEEARVRAQEKFAKSEQREKDAANERHKAFAAVVAKMQRLRSLRLAKEASDKEASDKEASEKKAKKRGSRGHASPGIIAASGEDSR